MSIILQKLVNCLLEQKKKFNSINLLDIGHVSSLITDSEHLSQSRFCSGHYEQLHHSLLGRRMVTPPKLHQA